MRKVARPHAIRKTSGPETRVSLGVALQEQGYQCHGVIVDDATYIFIYTFTSANDMIIQETRNQALIESRSLSLEPFYSIMHLYCSATYQFREFDALHFW